LTLPGPGHSYDIEVTSPEHTRRVGEILGRFLRAGSVVCLRGELGSGKTCLTQGIGRGLGVSGIIHSPTFVLISEHPPLEDGPWLYHADLYRISEEADALALGLDEYMYGDGVLVIEWADRAVELIPDDALWITLVYIDENRRHLFVDSVGQSYRDLIASWHTELCADERAASGGGTKRDS